MKFFRVSLITRMERNEAITTIGDKLSVNGGWIISHTLLSNIAATINFELPTNKVEDFLSDLEGSSLSSNLEVQLPNTNNEEVRGQLTITFIHDGPDLKRDVPAFG